MPSHYKKGYSDIKSTEYIKAHYDQFSLRVPKGDREKYKALAESQGKSLNQYIIELLDEQCIRQEQQAERALAYAERMKQWNKKEDKENDKKRNGTVGSDIRGDAGSEVGGEAGSEV